VVSPSIPKRGVRQSLLLSQISDIFVASRWQLLAECLAMACFKEQGQAGTAVATSIINWTRASILEYQAAFAADKVVDKAIALKLVVLTPSLGTGLCHKLHPSIYVSYT